MLAHEYLLEVLSYDPATGVFTWLPARDKKRGPKMAGKRAGSRAGEGYWYIDICCVKYRASRLAFFYMTGEWPQQLVDHINRNREDDRWCNLREVSPSENRMNYVRDGYRSPPDLSLQHPNAFAA
jgi:hypothetical protein